uniref:exodeoxyribonuclease III n=1 Tax=Sinocyclocheilus grahami TaxID=75366 RepID=A0A672M9Q5_SINGR
LRILTILSWNVNGFNRKRSEVLHHLSLLKADVVFLQETHVGPDRIYSTGSIKIQDLEGDYMAAFTVFKGSSRGVAVLFKKNLGCGGFNVNCDEKGRFIIILCQIWGHDFVFINMYNSNDEKIKLKDFTQISTHIPHSAYLVVGGDFNTVMDADLDKTSNLRNRSHTKSFDALRCFLENFSLLDVWRCLYPEVKSFTYFDRKGQSRLDYFFLQSHNLTSVTASKAKTTIPTAMIFNIV